MFVLYCVLVDCNSSASNLSSRGIVFSGAGPTLAGNNIGAWTLVQCANGYGWSDNSGNIPLNYTCTAATSNPNSTAGSWLVANLYCIRASLLEVLQLSDWPNSIDYFGFEYLFQKPHGLSARFDAQCWIPTATAIPPPATRITS